MRRAVQLSFCFAVAACDGGGGSAGGAPVPGVSQDGWSSEFREVRFACGDGAAAILASNAARVTVADTTLVVGYDQASGNNQNPVVARIDGDELVFCVSHETEGPDSRAIGITWDGGEVAYVVYSTDGGGSGLEGGSGWVSSYAPGAVNGGGPKVSVLGQVSAQTGDLSAATFVIAITSENRVNTHGAVGAATVLENGDIEFLGASRFRPIDSDRTAMECDNPGEGNDFMTRYVFSADLTDLVCAEASACTATTPCR